MAETADIEKARDERTIDPMSSGLPREGFKPGQRLGVPGFAITGGYLLPKDADARLNGNERYRRYSEALANISIVATGVRNFLDLVSGAGWSFEPADDSAEAEEIAEFVDQALNEMETSFSRTIRRASMFKFYGFSVQEWTAIGREDGRIGFADLEPRPQSTIERWDVDDRGTVRGMWQRNPGNGAQLYLPREKLFYVTDDSLSDSPEGLGLFRHMMRTAAGLSRFEDLEHWGFETDLQGMPVGRAPLAELQKAVEAGTMTKAQADAAKYVMTNFIENHIKGPRLGIMLDSTTYQTTDDKQAPSSQKMWDVELLKSGGTSHAQIDIAIRRKTFELARLIGAEHILIGADGAGSLALHTSATRRLHGMVNSTLAELADASDKQLIRKLMMLNGVPQHLWPKAKPEKVEYRTVEEVTGALSQMASAGAPLMPGDPAIDEVRDLIGLSRPDPASAIMQELLELGVAADPGEVDDESGRQGGAARPGSRGKQPGARAVPGKGGSGGVGAALDALRVYLEGGKATAG